MTFRSNVRRTDGASPPSLSRGTMIAFIVILCVVVVGFDLYKTWTSRSAQIEGSRREVVNLAWSAAQHAEVAFRLADTGLIGLVERVEVEGTGPEQLERLRKVMALRMAASPILQSITLIDATGDTIVNDLPVTRRVNVAERAFFQHHLTDLGREPHVSELLHSKVTGEWVIAVSRRVNRPDGGFVGILTATIAVPYFQAFYNSFDLGNNGSAALFRDDGNLLVRHPAIEPGANINLSQTSLFREFLPKAMSGSFEIRSSIDGVLKIYAYRRVAGFPLVVVVALSLEEELANWRASAALAVTALLGFFAIRLTRQMRLLARTEQAAARAVVSAGWLSHEITETAVMTECLPGPITPPAPLSHDAA